MRIFAIETSCDETAMALLKEEAGVLCIEKNLVASQMDIHAKYGGVVPEVAARKHVEVLPAMLREAVDSSGEGIDAIAVTYGPGLAIALRPGIEVARVLANEWQKPIVGVNHLEGHIYANWIDANVDEVELPALVLIVSGGHTEIVLMKDHGEYEILGDTRDDAAGEAFDKVAKMLRLGYPGGPIISRYAAEGNRDAFELPRPMINDPSLDMSFSGLKTAVRYLLQDTPEEVKSSEVFIQDLSASFEKTVTDVLVTKLGRAIESHKPKTVLLGGGVAANKYLRENLQLLCNDLEVAFRAPNLSYTTDNAAMIAAAGYFKLKKSGGQDPFSIFANPNLSVID